MILHDRLLIPVVAVMVAFCPNPLFSASFYSYYDPSNDVEQNWAEALAPHSLPGGFNVNASASTSLTYTDNVRNSETNRQSDFGNTTEARLSIASDWERHSVEAGVAGAFTKYRDYDGEDSEHLSLWLNGRADIGEQTQLLAGIAQREETEARDDPLAPLGLSERRDFGVSSGHLGFQYDGVLLASGKGEWSRTTFENSVDGNDFSYENHDDARYQLRLGYPLTDDLAVFVQPAYSTQDYSRNDPGGINRDSDAMEALAGVSYRFTDITQGEIGAGYIRRTFDDNRLEDASDMAVHGVISWQGIEDLLVRGWMDRTVRATTLAGVNDLVVTTTGLSLAYLLDEDWRITGLASFDMYDFSGVDRQDDVVTLGLGADYRIREGLWTSLNYRYRNRDSNAAGRDFDSNTLLLSLGFAI